LARAIKSILSFAGAALAADDAAADDHAAAHAAVSDAAHAAVSAEIRRDDVPTVGSAAALAAALAAASVDLSTPDNQASAQAFHFISVQTFLAHRMA